MGEWIKKADTQIHQKVLEELRWDPEWTRLMSVWKSTTAS